MKIHKSNWLTLLGESILKRGTLYPDREDGRGELDSSNWLKKLRDDIIKRQTLYPHGENIGLITETNFAIKLRDSILKGGDEIETEDEIEIPHDEWPLIPNPISAIDTWMKGEKGRTADDKKWISKIDFNVWQPSEYPEGWEAVVEAVG